MSILLDGDPAAYVCDGARITGGRGDAFVRIDEAEHQRRRQTGLGAITQLWMLDALMNLPLGQPVSVDGLTESEQWVLDRLPAGAAQRDGRWITRVCRPVSEIAAVVMWSPQWQGVLSRIAPFTRVAQRMIVLEQVPSDFEQLAWQARYQGTGVWAATANGATELVRAEPVQHRYFKPARWQVYESAYRAWLMTQPGPAPSSPDDPDGSARPKSGQSVQRSEPDPGHGSSPRLRPAPS